MTIQARVLAPNHTGLLPLLRGSLLLILVSLAGCSPNNGAYIKMYVIAPPQVAAGFIEFLATDLKRQNLHVEVGSGYSTNGMIHVLEATRGNVRIWSGALPITEMELKECNVTSTLTTVIPRQYIVTIDPRLWALGRESADSAAQELRARLGDRGFEVIDVPRICSFRT